jgi:hypothetical protein
MYNQASIYKGGGVYKMGEASALPDNYEKPKRYAVVGDDVYADANGNVHFLVASTINQSTLPSGWEYVGAVALRKGSKATILHKNENSGIKFANLMPEVSFLWRMVALLPLRRATAPTNSQPEGSVDGLIVEATRKWTFPFASAYTTSPTTA